MSQQPLSQRTGALCVWRTSSVRKRQHPVEIAMQLNGAAFAATRATWLNRDLLGTQADGLTRCRSVT